MDLDDVGAVAASACAKLQDLRNTTIEQLCFLQHSLFSIFASDTAAAEWGRNSGSRVHKFLEHAKAMEVLVQTLMYKQ